MSIEALARGLLRGYEACWRHANSQIVLHDAEMELTCPLFNVETGRRSRTFTLAGFVDKLADENGLTIYDHKTTSSSIEDPDAPYWRQLAVESQPSHYSLLAKLNGLDIQRVVWDVVKKPAIRPRKLKNAELDELLAHGTYFSQCMPEETLNAVAAKDLTTEDDALYEARVYYETYTNPSKYFARRSVTRLTDELAEYAAELWDIGQVLLDARRKQAWYRNADSCMNYGTPCEYLGICSGHDTPDSDRWVIDEREPNALSASRLKCFQSCRRKYYYRYEKQIVRFQEEEREALLFGTLWHQMLDAFWAKHTQQGESYDSEDSEASAAKQSAVDSSPGLPG